MNTQSIGLYNSGPLAGASQLHKHLQIVPLDFLKEFRTSTITIPAAASSSNVFEDLLLHPIPIDDIIQDLISDNTWKSMPKDIDANYIYSLNQFEFEHYFVVLTKNNQNPLVNKDLSVNGYSFYLYSIYVYLLSLAGIDIERISPCIPSVNNEQCKDYNLILTETWMLLVPRSKIGWAPGITVNCLTFLGFFLMDYANYQSIHDTPLLSLLKSVGVEPSAPIEGLVT
jgi:ATP adenylyltransferase/5',5'''-P-1,P-4-tetraphosphate phosphorylase II